MKPCRYTLFRLALALALALVMHGAASAATVGAAYVSIGPDNDTRLLDAYTDGSISIRRIDSSGNVINFFNYGPFYQWTAIGIATGPDCISRILWINASGKISIWTM